jgi:hypothetical protein
MIAYKLLRVRKDGTVGPLFINRKLVIPVGEWLAAESHPTKGFQVRPGWHVMAQPIAPHLSEKGRKWFVVEIEDYTPYTRPAAQGGLWYLANRMKLVAPCEKDTSKKFLQVQLEFPILGA